MSTVPVHLNSPISTRPSSSSDSMDLSNLTKDIVGPISEKYCLYFYILSVLAVVFFAVIFVGIIWTGVTKKMGFSFFFLSLLYSTQFLLIYLQNRLLYNMCVNSVV